MQLKYRGVQYDQDAPAVEMVPGQPSGMYRGQRFSFDYPKHIPVPQSLRGLQYRGVAYEIDAAGEVESLHAVGAVQAAPTFAFPTQARRKKRVMDARQVHQQTILQHLQHRIEVAKARGDEQLVRQLEQEWQQFV